MGDGFRDGLIGAERDIEVHQRADDRNRLHFGYHHGGNGLPE